jgi:hypothetical protein
MALPRGGATERSRTTWFCFRRSMVSDKNVRDGETRRRARDGVPIERL